MNDTGKHKGATNDVTDCLLYTSLRGQDPYEVYHYLLTKRLGAEIDYVVKGIDRNTGLAVGSRKDAMATKRRHYYLNQTRDGTYLSLIHICWRIP